MKTKEKKAGKSLLAEKVASLNQVTRTVKNGVQAEAFFELVEVSGYRQEELASLLELSVRTLNRYRKEHKKLNAKESELLVKLSVLFQRGTEIFGSMPEFSHWLGEPAYGLDHQLPFNLLYTSEGVNLVADEVERIAYGDLA